MTWLVIGIGNSLRRDDGLGPWLVERIGAWRLPGVRTRVVHQLAPELAIEISRHDRVLFVDASATGDDGACFEIGSAEEPNRLGHALGPEELLALTECLGGARPRAWVAPVAARDFDFGEGFSEAATQAGERALIVIGQLLRGTALCTK